MKVSQSRKSTHTIMNNPGYGMLKIKRGKYEILIPETWLFSDGRLKKYAQSRINKMFKSLELLEVSCNEEVCM